MISSPCPTVLRRQWSALRKWPPVAQPQRENGGQMGYGAQPQPYFERPAFNADGNERPVERQERARQKRTARQKL